MTKKTVFISYAREDEEAAVKLYNDLLAQGFQPWLDKKDILPGYNWKSEIRKAIRACGYFIAILSDHSVSKRGFVQRELKEALEILKELPEFGVFVVPARLNHCTPSYEALRDIQWVDLFPSYENGLKLIIRTLNADGDMQDSEPQLGNIQHRESESFPNDQISPFLLGYYVSSVFGLSNPRVQYSEKDAGDCRTARVRTRELLSALNLDQVLLPEDFWAEGNKVFVDFMNKITALLRARSSKSLAAFHLGSYGHIHIKNPEVFPAPFEFLAVAERAGFDTTPLKTGGVSQLEYLVDMVRRSETAL